MGGPEKSLYDYMQILNSPEVYPDIQSAGYYLSPLLKIVSNAVAIIGIIAMVFIFLRMGVDVLIMAGFGSAIADKASGKLLKFSSFNNLNDTVIGDVPQYFKKYGWKLLLMFIFVGIMVSGQMLPLAGTLTAVTGTAISRVAKIDPTPYLDALSITETTVTNTLEKATINSLMKDYSSYTSNLTAIRQRLRNPSDLTDSEYDQLAEAYYKSYLTAEIYSIELQGWLHNIMLRTSGNAKDGSVVGDPTSMTDDEQNLRNFDMRAHTRDVDQVLLQRGKELANDSTLEQVRQSKLSALQSAKQSNTAYPVSSRRGK